MDTTKLFSATAFAAIIGLAALAAVGARADGVGASPADTIAESPPQVIHSDRTRAQVRAETVAAEEAGQIPEGELDIAPADFGVMPAVHSDTTRAQVRAQAAAAVKAGTIVGGEAGYAGSYM